MRIRKAVITAAGLGTRLLPATKEQPKEMLPIYARTLNGEICLKPVLQLIFEQLYDYGLREFCMVIGRGKRAIEDHFTQDHSYTTFLRKKQQMFVADELEAFYRRLDDSVISWITQPEPNGFGDAVLRTERAVGEEQFFVHAGDVYIVAKNGAHYSRLVTVTEHAKSEATLLIQELPDPRGKGIVEVRKESEEVYAVTSAVEKPQVTKSKLAIEPVYVFQPSIFDALRDVGRGQNREVQLTDGIAALIKHGRVVCATWLKPDEKCLDIGDVDSHWEAIALSHRLAGGR
jgi:UTP--glucose-1-phosphate uridylyltransferase